MSTTTGSLSSVTDHSNGTYTATLTSPTSTASAATISGTINGLTIASANDATVTFTPGAASASASTVSSNPGSVTADGLTTSTVTVTLLDGHSNPVSNKIVTLAQQGGGHSTITTVSGTTNSSGQATFHVTDTTAETDTYTATDTTDSNLVITATAQVTFTAPLGSATNSTVVAAPITAVANGTSTSTITVTVLDANSNPVSNKTVTLAQQGGGHSTITTVSGTTAANGQATFHVTDTTAEADTFTATDTTDSVTIAQTAAVTFYSGTITQIAPISATVSASNYSSFTSQLNTSGSDGHGVTVVENPSTYSSYVVVSSSGVVTTAGSLSAGSYTVAGTDSDGTGNGGTWTFTLSVTAVAPVVVAAPPPVDVPPALSFGTPSTVTATPTTTTTVTVSSGGASTTISVPPGALPTGTVVSVYPVTNTAALTTSIPTGYSCVMGFAVTWQAPDGSVPTATAPITTTVNDPTIVAGDTVYQETSTGLVAVGRATANGVVTITFTNDPTFLVLHRPQVTLAQTSAKSGSTNVTTSADFFARLAVSGKFGKVTYRTTKPAHGIRVSSRGAVTATGTLGAGTYTVSGTDRDAAGDTGAWTYTLKVIASPPAPGGKSKVDTTTDLFASANQVLAGSTVTFTAKVTSVKGPNPDSGTVTFVEGSSTIGSCSLADGTCQLVVSSSGLGPHLASSLALGRHVVTAIYAGSARFVASTSQSLSESVIGSTTTTLSSSASRAKAGAPLRFTATVTGSGGTRPTGGTVTFRNGSTAIGTCALSTSASCSVTVELSAGEHTISAAFSGSFNYLSSKSSPIIQEVRGSAATTTTVTADTNPATFGASVVLFTGRVDVTGGARASSGTISFQSGSSVVGVCSLSGTDSCSISTASLSAGTHSIIASYSGVATQAVTLSPSRSAPYVEIDTAGATSRIGGVVREGQAALATNPLSGFADRAVFSVQAIGSRAVATYDASGQIRPVTGPTPRGSESNLAHHEPVAASAAAALGGIPGYSVATWSQYASDSALADPKTVNSYLGTSDHTWVEATVDVRSYVPGSLVFLATTPESLAFAEAAVGPDGRAVLSGAFPADLAGSGLLQIRVVGERNLGSGTTNAEGQAFLSSATAAQIRQFDPNSTATVRIVGVAPDRTVRTVVLIVSLSAAGFSLWMLLLLIAVLLLALVCIAVLLIRRRQHSSGRARHVESQAPLVEPMAAELQLALDRDELVLVFQPIASLAEGRFIGAEALLRWKKPDNRVLLPDDFIPVAEASGLIIPIGRWVLKTACAQLRDWKDANSGSGDWYMSVNVTASQLADPDFPDVVVQTLTAAGLSPAALHIELTESEHLEGEVVLGALSRLREIGVRLLVDDFGTKFATLSYLTNLPVDELKIDQSFIAGVVGNPMNQAIVAAILAIGRTLGMPVIAEGVETANQLAELRILGCELVQGFYFSGALPPGDCLRALASAEISVGWPDSET